MVVEVTVVVLLVGVLVAVLPLPAGLLVGVLPLPVVLMEIREVERPEGTASACGSL